MTPLGLGAAAYCVAMALASRLTPQCPCCGEEVRISRLVAAVVWAGLGGALLVLRGRRAPLFGAAALLSGVQVANFWQQFRHDGMSRDSIATWIIAVAALGFLAFAALAVVFRKKASAA